MEAVTNLPRRLSEGQTAVSAAIQDILSIPSPNERSRAWGRLHAVLEDHVAILQRAAMACEAERSGRAVFQHGLEKLLEDTTISAADRKLLREAAGRVRLEERREFREEIKPDVSDQFVEIKSSIDGVRLCFRSQGNSFVNMLRSTKVKYYAADAVEPEARWQQQRFGTNLCARGEQERSKKDLSEGGIGALRSYLEEMDSPLQNVSSWKALSSFLLLTVAAPELAEEEGVGFSDDYWVHYGWPAIGALFEGYGY